MGVNIRKSEGYMDTVPFQALSGIDHEAKAASKPAFRPLVYICSPFPGTSKQIRRRLWISQSTHTVTDVFRTLHICCSLL